MVISNKLKELVKEFEGCKLKASNEALIAANHKLKTLRTILYIMFVFSVVLVMLKKLIW